MTKTILIIGAGPAGLTAGIEMLRHSDFNVIILEQSDMLGGISRTEKHAGNRIDIGGHRFFSKSDRVLNWWLSFLPLTNELEQDNYSTTESLGSKSKMLLRNRISRILFQKKLFDYPLRFTINSLIKLGLLNVLLYGISYLKAKFFFQKEIRNLEDFMIQRFGKRLYQRFFKSYTEKVWGISCKELSAEWGEQRIKTLSISEALLHFLKSLFIKNEDLKQKNTETSLIERFLYPMYGPGQLWEVVGKEFERLGGTIYFNQKVMGIHVNGKQLQQLKSENTLNNKVFSWNADYIISSMPIKELVECFESHIFSKKLKNIAYNLPYRDFITLGLLLEKSAVKDIFKHAKDNWLYIQDEGVNVGRIQLFHNWSPYMLKNQEYLWVGLEYFCYEGDDLWSLSDEAFLEMGIKELQAIHFLKNNEKVLDHKIIRVPKAYPSYTGTYSHFDELKAFLNTFDNLFLVGRNGMHRYNNQDHSMLTAMYTVEEILKNAPNKDRIWNVNTEQEYHEEAHK